MPAAMQDCSSHAGLQQQPCRVTAAMQGYSSHAGLQQPCRVAAAMQGYSSHAGLIGSHSRFLKGTKLIAELCADG